MLGRLHDLVARLTESTEMTEEQEEEYSHLMGGLEETLKQNETQRLEADERATSLQKRSTELELKNEDFEEKIKQLEE